MTVTVTSTFVRAAGNNVTTVVNFPFLVTSSGDLVVRDILDSTGTPTTLVLDTHYTVHLSATGEGGTVTFLSALVSGHTYDIRSNIPATQGEDIRNQGRFLAEIHEGVFDKAIRLIQDLSRKVGQSIQAPDYEASPPSFTLPNAVQRALNFLAFDANGNIVVSSGTGGGDAALRNDLANTTTAGKGNDLVSYRRTAAEIAVGVTPVNYTYASGHAQRFAILDGTTDDTTALTNWAKVPGYHYFPALTAKITGAIALESNSTYDFARGATIQTATQNISLFSAASKTNILIRGGKFKQTSAGNTAEVAGVKLQSCTYCWVIDSEFDGMQWCGVFLDSSSHCIISGNYCHDFLASAAGDHCDICVYRNSSYNLIEGNHCYGGTNSWVGVLVQDPGGLGTYLPKSNKVVNNWVTAHSGYGIAVYIGGSQESYNIVHGNDVEGITGSADVFYGTGIYCVGAGLGGLEVTDNRVRNCCISTTSVLNGPGGITVTGNVSGDIQPIVSGNTVEGMTQGSGILIISMPGGCVVTSNVVRMPSTNNGTGPGGGTLAGQGISVSGTSNVTVSANTVRHNGPQDGILVQAPTANLKNIKVVGNGVITAAGNPIRFDRTAAFVMTLVTVASNTVETPSNTPNAITCAGLDLASVTGNAGGCGTQPALAFSACTNTRVANNSLNSNGATGVTMSNTCTGSYYDKTNLVPGVVSNTSTGFNFEQFGDAVPVAGAAIIGDRIERKTATVGGAKGWRCTSGGAPGTWTSEGVL